jgi:hypothetical protein
MNRYQIEELNRTTERIEFNKELLAKLKIIRKEY